ncbi:NUDIX domain-containing protein [Knoellia koreensis]|uniref:NUDIX domain-containing protein n=1 Tax=Knoellia koreensis TaxID=2730921 RepID=A0A849HG76_9MICO|nr:NUDIX domain-containing protein [Knoellia sp. DB2414S]
MSEVVRRRAARVLVVSPEGEVLMINAFDPQDPATTYWYTVGGGVDAGESDLDAAVREVWEETGLRVDRDQLVGPVHHDRTVFPFEGRTIDQEQVFFLLATPRFDPAPAAFEETEIRSVITVAWVDPAARERAGETVYPAGLASLVAQCAKAAAQNGS